MIASSGYRTRVPVCDCGAEAAAPPPPCDAAALPTQGRQRAQRCALQPGAWASSGWMPRSARVCRRRCGGRSGEVAATHSIVEHCDDAGTLAQMVKRHTARQKGSPG